MSAELDAIEITDSRDLPADQVLELYRALNWSSAEQPERLMAALAGSHRVVTAWHDQRLVGLGNSLSDGHLVVYYPHLAVHPDYQRQGIGRAIMERMLTHYAGMHQHAVIADGRALEFYGKCGFEPAGNTRSMWIYQGNDH